MPFVRRVVLEAFVGKRPQGLQCRHLDGNGLNNALDNLVWGTREANSADSRRHGTLAIGSKHGMTELHESDIKDIREAYKRGVSERRLANVYGVSKSLIRQIVRGVIWKHV
jgi:hypothetical protein